MEAATNCKDVEIVKTICCAIVSTIAIVVIGALAWKLIDKISNGISGWNKRNWDVEDKEWKQKTYLQDKLLVFLEKNTTSETYNSKLDKYIKTLRGIGSEESRYYVKVMLSLISDKTISDYLQKTKIVEKKTTNE